MDGENILTIDQLVSAFPAFGEKTVRWWIYNGKSNGFEACLIRIGSRIYIDRKRFIDWVKSHRPVQDVPEDFSKPEEELETVE
ncbi:hypothetical protein [Qipengyuania flava]|uniref:hypothetical protein n=1 Tax=Qipengyuania flava TaxID=192812 RepID=UPI00273DF381|nr:hypothetical protein [Qipengyuania flava]